MKLDFLSLGLNEYGRGDGGRCVIRRPTTGTAPISLPLPIANSSVFARFPRHGTSAAYKFILLNLFARTFFFLPITLLFLFLSDILEIAE